jgi:hypothetical protein
LRAENAIGKSGEILDQRGKGKLPARLVALDDQRFQVGPRRIQSGSVSGTTGADDDYVASFVHILKIRMNLSVPIRWLRCDLDAQP